VATFLDHPENIKSHWQDGKMVRCKVVFPILRQWQQLQQHVQRRRLRETVSSACECIAKKIILQHCWSTPYKSYFRHVGGKIPVDQLFCSSLRAPNNLKLLVVFLLLFMLLLFVPFVLFLQYMRHAPLWPC